MEGGIFLVCLCLCGGAPQSSSLWDQDDFVQRIIIQSMSSSSSSVAASDGKFPGSSCEGVPKIQQPVCLSGSRHLAGTVPLEEMVDQVNSGLQWR